jgi:hypothetical protein
LGEQRRRFVPDPCRSDVPRKFYRFGGCDFGILRWNIVLCDNEFLDVDAFEKLKVNTGKDKEKIRL